LQGQIATRVAAALGRVLRQDDELKLAARPTSNAAAYDLYLKAKAINNNSAVAQRTAANHLEQAVALDANFAEAWALLGESLSRVYFNGTRDPAVRARAQEAIERALQLAEGEMFAHRAASAFYARVERDDIRSRREINRALAINPNDAEILALSAEADFTTEEFGAALDKLARARELDPLSVQAANSHIRALVYLGRLNDAQIVAQDLLALDPMSPQALEWAAVVHLANGDVQGARRVVVDALARGVPETELVSYFAGYNELAFVLVDEQLQLLFRLTPAAFDNDRAWWGQSLAIAARQRGDLARARAYADSALPESKVQSDGNPSDPQLRALYAVMLAYTGQLEAANREADRAVNDAPENSNLDRPYARMQRLRVRLASNNINGALDDLEAVLGKQYHVSPGYTRTDPTFDPLRGTPRFVRMFARPFGVPVDSPRPPAKRERRGLRGCGRPDAGKRLKPRLGKDVG
jgi:tetratricopeptide (TPR) repeat protein